MKNIFRLFLLLFSLSAFAQVPQTGGSGGGGGGVRYGISTPVVLGTDKKGDEYFRTTTGDNTALASESYLFDGTQWNVRPVGSAISEDGFVNVISQTFNTATYVNSTNGVYNLPSAGRWRLRYDLSTDGSGQASPDIMFAILDPSDNVVAGTEKTRGGGLTTAQVLTAETFVTTNGAATYRLKGKNGGSGTTVILSGVSNSTISWEKVSGFLPVSGQSGDYFSVVRNTSQTVALGTDILFNTTPIGNLAYNSTTGLVTLLANKRYKIKAKLTARNDGTGTTGRYIIYAFYNELNVQYINGTRIDGTHFLSTSTLNEAGNTEASITLETNSDIQIKVRINSIDGSNWTLDGDRCKLEIEQVGTNVFSFPVSSSSIVNGVTNTANTGTSFTANVGFTHVNPASLVSAMTITLPGSPALGDKVQLLFGGTIGANQPVITTPTIAPNSGQSIYGNITFTQAKGGDEIEYTYISANNWFRTK